MSQKLFDSSASSPSRLLHQHTFLPDLSRAFLGLVFLAVHLQSHGARLVHVQQLLEQLLDVGVVLGGRLQEVTPPLLSLRERGEGGVTRADWYTVFE